MRLYFIYLVEVLHGKMRRQFGFGGGTLAFLEETFFFFRLDEDNAIGN